MKKRHIEIEVVKVNDNEVIFKIAKQTHREYEFCQQSKLNKFIASNGYTLVSIYLPSFDSESHTLFCQGELVNHDDNGVSCNFEDFAKICEAITEYNTTDGKGYVKEQIEDYYYIISADFTITELKFNNSDYDLENKKTGNFFHTREEAEETLKLFKYILKYKTIL